MTTRSSAWAVLFLLSACGGPDVRPEAPVAADVAPPAAADGEAPADAAPPTAQRVRTLTLPPPSEPVSAQAPAPPSFDHPEAAALRLKLQARHPQDLPTPADLSRFADPAGALRALVAGAEPLVRGRAAELLGAVATSEADYAGLLGLLAGEGVAPALQPRLRAAAARGLGRTDLGGEQGRARREALLAWLGGDPQVQEAVVTALAAHPDGRAALTAAVATWDAPERAAIEALAR